MNVKHPGPSVGGNTETHPHIQNVVAARVGRGRAGAGGSGGRSVGLQLPLRWLPPGVRRLLHQLSLGGRRLGRHLEPRRQQRAMCRTTATAATRRSRSWRPNTHSSSRSTSCDPIRLARASGAGAWELTRTFSVNAPEITVNALFDRTRTHAPGHVRRQGRGQRRHLHSAPRRRRVSSVLGGLRNGFRFQVHPRAGDQGDRIILQSPGGGGFGDPRERPPELVEEDVRQGFIIAGGGSRILWLQTRDRLCSRGGSLMAEWRENDAAVV